MGVPSLFSYYYRKYKKEGELLTSLESLCKYNIKHLFFDYNSLIHPCAQQILSANHGKYILDPHEIEEDIITNCINYTQYIIDIINVKSLYIVIDGVAPRSKMNQQRERRYKSHFFKDLESEKSSLWDSNKITPGTLFMDKLTLTLRNWTKTQKDIHIHISDSNEPGEGEHKMMRIIDNTKDNVCIYGLDADLIFLSMLHKQSDKIILIRDNSFQGNIEEGTCIDYLNIKNLTEYILKDISEKFKIESGKVIQISKQDLIQDYILLCFFLGNDFLEHLHPVHIKEHGIDIVLKAYIKASSNHHSYLVNNKLINDPVNWKKSINLVFLKDIFYQLKNYEDYYIKQGRKRHTKIDLKQIEEYNLKPLESTRLYFYTDFETGCHFKDTFHNFYGMNTDNIDDICFKYIEGLYWVLGYYNSHIHNNWSWYYTYNAVPFCNDIFTYLKTNIHQNRLQSEIDSTILPNKAYSNIKQLCLVLPKESILQEAKLNGSVAKQLLKFINKENDYITNLFPDKLYVDIINKEYLWQSKILFKPIDEDILDILF
jgi:5'-3' exonuclease